MASPTQKEMKGEKSERDTVYAYANSYLLTHLHYFMHFPRRRKGRACTQGHPHPYVRCRLSYLRWIRVPLTAAASPEKQTRPEAQNRRPTQGLSLAEWE
jgi:hypothetical protein